MAKEFIPLSIRIDESTQKLKKAGYVVINTDDEKFAILAERIKITCKSCSDFFNKAEELTKDK